MSLNPYSNPTGPVSLPLSVRVVRALLWIVGGLTLVTALDVWFVVGGSYGFGAALVVVPPAVASLVAARFTRVPGRRTWWWVVFLQVIYLVWQLSRIPAGDPFAVLGLAFPVGILVAGSRPDARRHFRGDERPRTEPVQTARSSDGDRGGSLVSYLAVVGLVATVSVALMASSLPGKVSGGIHTAVCTITRDDHCADDQSTDTTASKTAPKTPDTQITTTTAGNDATPPSAVAPPPAAPQSDRDDGGDGDDVRHDCWDWTKWYCEAGDGLREGLGTAAKETGHGVASLACLIGVCGPTRLHKSQVAVVKGIGHLFTTSPKTTATAIWNQTTQPIRDDWNSGHKSRAVGRAIPTAVSLIFVGKGLTKLRKLAKARKIDKPPHHHGTGDLGEPISAAENALREKAQRVPWKQHPDLVKKIEDHNGASVVYKMELGKDSYGAYKPDRDGPAKWKGEPLPAGGMANREVAFYRANEMFGFDLVPPTTIVNGPRGRGSVQVWINNAVASKSLHSYSFLVRERMAVLDYVAGNTDRYAGNFLDRPPVTTKVKGKIAGPQLNSLWAIDNHFSFPESTIRAIRSDFVVERLNVPLSNEVLTSVRAVDPEQYGKMLRASGLGEKAVDGSVARLVEVQSRGMITGEAWPGGFDTGTTPATKVDGWPLKPH